MRQRGNGSAADAAELAPAAAAERVGVAQFGGPQTQLWCTWLAWSRFRVVIPIRTYALTDNEKTVSIDHIATIAVRNPGIVEVGRHYGLTIRTCTPYLDNRAPIVPGP